MAKFIELTELSGPRRILLNLEHIITVQEWVGCDDDDTPHGKSYVETKANTFSVFEALETVDEINALISAAQQ